MKDDLPSAPYYVFPPITKDDWWGVYGSSGIEKAFRFRAQAEDYCARLNYNAGRIENDRT